MLTVNLLGSVAIRRDSEPITGFRSQSEVALLAYLAHTGETHSREMLADLLWEARTTSQSLSNLRTVLSRLRKLVGDDLIVTRRTVAFRPQAVKVVDSVRLQSVVAEIGRPQSPGDAKQLATVLETFTGDFLAGFYLPDAPRFNDWVIVEQERIHQRVMTGLQNQIGYALDTSDLQAGIPAARRWLALDELSEIAHTSLIRLLALSGETAAALSQYERLCDVLDTELGITPQPATLALVERIRRGVLAPSPSPAQPEPGPRPHNLPRDLTPFIGRADERAALVERLIDPDYPLVVLAGEGGIGKTRLSLAAARSVAESSDGAFPDGVWFVPLAGLVGERNVQEEIAVATAVAMRLTLSGERPPVEQLLALLAPRSALIVLDNLEQLLPDAADLVVDLLQGAPDIHLLITSRIPLNLQAEYVMRLQGLSVPDAPDKALASDSVQLFAERAERTGGAFVLTTCVADVIAICRYLAGVPLAIELAAAWTARMACSDIAARIASNVSFLATEQRDVPQRQRSMRAAFDYSWALLSTEARKALMQASVFRGGFDRTAVAAVMQEQAAQADFLVEHSLLYRNDNGQYSMHELLRELAAERLVQRTRSPGETEVGAPLRQRHGDHYLKLVGDVTVAGERSEATMRAATLDLDNIRQAWWWAVEERRTEALATAWEGLWYYYRRHALFQEGCEAFGRAIDAVDDLSPTDARAAWVRARLQVVVASFLITLTRYGEAIALARDVIQNQQNEEDTDILAHSGLLLGTALFRQSHFDEALGQLELALEEALMGDDGYLKARIRRRMGTTLLELGDPERGRSEMVDALAGYRRLQIRMGEANVLTDLGWLEQRAGHLDVARDHLERALTIQRELDNRHGITMTLINLAGVSSSQRKFDETYAYHLEALSNLEHIDDRYHESLVNHGLGLHLSRLGDYDEARPYYEKSLAIDRAIGDEAGVAWTENNLGLLYNHLGEYDTALTLHQDSLRIARALPAPTIEGLALSRIGQDLYGLGRLSEAAEALAAAASIQTELNQPAWLMETNGSRANVLIDQNNTTEAIALVSAILPCLHEAATQGSREPMRLYWNCYRVLDATGDPRAGDLLGTARAELIRQATAIVNAAHQRSFQEAIPAHRLIMQGQL